MVRQLVKEVEGVPAVVARMVDLYNFPIKYCQLGLGSEIHSSP